MTASTDIRDRLADVRRRVAAAREAAGRGDDVTIVAVAKTHAPSAVLAAAESGITDVGENRVQELTAKRDHVDGQLDTALQWHLIGPLQRNKVNRVVGSGLLIHTVDRRSLVDAIVRHARDLETPQRVLVQVNVADDPAKSGCLLDDADELVTYSSSHPELAVEGLMTIPPQPGPDDDPNVVARPHFAALRELRDRLQPAHPGLVTLSMGMTSDLEAAIAEGATMVRLGSAIFGARGQGSWEPVL